MCSLVQDSTPPLDLADTNCKTQCLTTGVKECEKAAETGLGIKCPSDLVFQWDLVCEQRGLNQATATFFFIGVTMGAMVFGYLSDRFDPSQAAPLGPQFHKKNSTNVWPSVGNQRGGERRKGNGKGRIQTLN